MQLYAQNEVKNESLQDSKNQEESEKEKEENRKVDNMVVVGSKVGEIHITDAIRSLINEKNKFIAHNFSGKYLDCGSMNGYIKSSIEISKL